MPPATPTPSTYIQPSWKSNRCEFRKRARDVLHDDDEPDPGRKAFAQEQAKMSDPHGVEQDDAEQAPLHRDIRGSGCGDC